MFAGRDDGVGVGLSATGRQEGAVHRARASWRGRSGEDTGGNDRSSDEATRNVMDAALSATCLLQAGRAVPIIW